MAKTGRTTGFGSRVMKSSLWAILSMGYLLDLQRERAGGIK
jgi:hypothetical protein